MKGVKVFHYKTIETVWSSEPETYQFDNDGYLIIPSILLHVLLFVYLLQTNHI